MDNRTHKSFRLKATKKRRAERTIHAHTETEASEQENELATQANHRFLKSGAQIKDLYAWD